jgi:ABC-2 type transport system ATP-binding protein
MIVISNLTKRYKDLTALDGISLEIKDNELFGLLGPNGAGKSTTMNLIAGYISPDEGEIRINGKIVSKDNIKIKYKIGLAPQSLAIYEEISAEDNLKIFGSLYGISKGELKEIIKEKLNFVGLYERRKDLVKNYSGGMKRRLNMIAGLLHSPQVFLCDEPTVGVDPQSRNSIFEFLQKLNSEGMTIIYTTHYMEEAERMCQRIAIIDIGKIIAQGTLDELLNLLPFKETISIAKNEITGNKQVVFEKFGLLKTENEKIELKMNQDIKLSKFFSAIEENGISYNFIDFHKPTLEELFLNLTGRRLRD